jgi:hypothetical protein
MRLQAARRMSGPRYWDMGTSGFGPQAALRLGRTRLDRNERGGRARNECPEDDEALGASRRKARCEGCRPGQQESRPGGRYGERNRIRASALPRYMKVAGDQRCTRGHHALANGGRDDSWVDPLSGVAGGVNRPFFTGRGEQEREHRQVCKREHAKSARPHGRTIVGGPGWDSAHGGVVLNDRRANRPACHPWRTKGKSVQGAYLLAERTQPVTSGFREWS